MTPREAVQHHEARLGMAQEMGRKADALWEQAQTQIKEMQGGSTGLGLAIQACEGIKAHWKQAFTADKITREKLDLVFAAIDECEGAIRNHIEGHRHAVVQAQGAMNTAEQMRDIAEAAFNNEKLAVQMVLSELENPKPTAAGPRKVGEHPGPSIGDQRRRDAAEAGIHLVSEAPSPTEDAPDASDAVAQQPDGGDVAPTPKPIVPAAPPAAAPQSEADILEQVRKDEAAADAHAAAEAGRGTLLDKARAALTGKRK